MASSKKTLKLSLASSKATQNSTRLLDDTLEDFEDWWHVKSKRKKASCNKNDPGIAASGKVVDLSGANVSTQPGTSTYSSDNSSPVVKEPVRQTRKRAARRSKISKTDESDVSLAMAISASIETANERVRMNEEERLIEEGLSEVLTELRSEEAKLGSLLPAVHPPDQPMTQLKKQQPKTRKPKKTLGDFVLALRTPRERERLIAEKAAIILTSPEMPQCEEIVSIDHAEISSAYLKNCMVEDNTLWRKSTTTSELIDSAQFYVPELRSHLSPREKSAQPGTLFMHLSQIPGRIQSPRREPEEEEQLSTQAVLEDLLHRAQGGFVEDETGADVPTEKEQIHQNFSKLSSDWSHMLDNPLLSDVTVLLDRGQSIRAHRLVLAARCPTLLDHCVKEEENQWRLDWTGFDTEAARGVLRYLYTADTESLLSNTRNVEDIAALFNMNEILDLVGCSRYVDLHQSNENSATESNKESVIEPAGSSVRHQSPDLFNVEDVDPTPLAVEAKGEAAIASVDSLVRPQSPDLFDVDPGPSAVQKAEDVVDLTQDSPLETDYPPVENAMSGEATAPGPSALEADNIDEDFVDLTQNTPPEAPTADRAMAHDIDIWKDFDEANYDAIYTAPDPVDEAPVPVPVSLAPESPIPGGSKETVDSAHCLSFDINDSDLWRVDDNLETGKSSTPCATAARKKKRQETVQVTPLPDYKTMATPQLKQALDQYGLKPLKRKNAVKLLEHIYEELHPLVTDSETSSHDLSTSLQQLESEDSQSSLDSVVEESINVSDDLQPFTCNTQEPVSLKRKFQDFLQERTDIYERILLYEPLPVEWLLSELKSASIRCKSSQFIDWLDEQCIAFRMKNRRNAAAAAKSKPRAKPATRDTRPCDATED